MFEYLERRTGGRRVIRVRGASGARWVELVGAGESDGARALRRLHSKNDRRNGTLLVDLCAIMKRIVVVV